MLTVLWWMGILYAIGYSISAVVFCGFRVAAMLFPPAPARRRVYQPVPIASREDRSMEMNRL